MLSTLPNLLTLLRIVLVPFLMLAFYLEFELARAYVAKELFFSYTLAIFFVACLSDFFDGYLARELNCASKLGNFLDPLADKILIITAILLLVSINKIKNLNLLLIIIMVVRDLVISGLKNLGKNNMVLLSAKLKTTLQMLSLGGFFMSDTGLWFAISSVLLGLAAIFSVFSGYIYLKSAFKNL